jgi:cation diffusion facilitator CzcD-associated flavoprotein CzcO
MGATLPDEPPVYPGRVKVVIVGAGMSGICMGIKLLQARIPFVILEKSPRLGGTWWENTYPGCACDIPSHLYGLSFAPNPDWTRVYPQQPEILAYVERLAERSGVLPHIRFGVTVREARWDEGASRWRLTTAEGEVVEAEVYVSAVGALHVPRYPEVAGRGSFRGPEFHSARWDHSVDLAGKHVAVVGNAASAVQLVPQVAAQAERVTVYQRTAHWVLPKWDGPYPAWYRRFLRTFPLLERLQRWYHYLRQEAAFLAAFHQGSLIGGWIRRGAIANMRAQVPDAALQEALIPGYALGCKRVLLSNDYYAALARPNVELVTEAVEAVDEGGVVSPSGRREADVLVYATGFRPLAWGHVEVYGRGGRRLADDWAEAPRAYLGITVPRFPNYFLLLGPNTGLGHNSVMWMAECQVNHVLRCLLAMRRRSLATLEVRPEVLERYYADLERRLEGKVWTDCQSWYQTEAGRIYALWPRTTARYWWETRRPRLGRDYVVERREGGAAAAGSRLA